MKFRRRSSRFPSINWGERIDRAEPLKGQLWTRSEKALKEPDVHWSRRAAAGAVAVLGCVLLGCVLLCAPPGTDWRLCDLALQCDYAGKGRDARPPIYPRASRPHWLIESAWQKADSAGTCASDLLSSRTLYLSVGQVISLLLFSL